MVACGWNYVLLGVLSYCLCLRIADVASLDGSSFLGIGQFNQECILEIGKVQPSYP